MAQYVFTMNRLSKVVPPKRVLLKDISLSFFPGALHLQRVSERGAPHMLSVWGDVIVMVGTPVLLLLVVMGVYRLAHRGNKKREEP